MSISQANMNLAYKRWNRPGAREVVELTTFHVGTSADTAGPQYGEVNYILNLVFEPLIGLNAIRTCSPATISG